MAFSAVHHADPKYQQQVLNEIHCENASGLMKAEKNTLCYALSDFMSRTNRYWITSGLSSMRVCQYPAAYIHVFRLYIGREGTLLHCYCLKTAMHTFFLPKLY